MSTRRLGRGLDALIPALDVTDDDKVVQISLKELRANPYQPRKTFSDESIQELAASIKEHGVIQPIIVRKVLKGYEIIAGERRFRASQLCGLETIPCVVRDFTDQQVMEIALIENLQREDLNAIEIANAYQNLIDQFHYTQEELSTRVGKSRSHIANFLRLLQLPQEIKDYVSRGTLSMGHARAIVGVQDETTQKELAQQTIRNRWSVRELEAAIQGLSEKKDAKPKKPKRALSDPYIEQAEARLREYYRTTVKIRHQKSKGKIEISYYSIEDLERLLGLLEADAAKTATAKAN
jgi:ParB family chromosome partitioning protein